MEIEVVLRQVRERTDRERDAVHAVQRQRMGRDLHHHMRAARIEHLPQQALQGKALGRRALRGDDGVADAVFDRADEADLRAERLLEHMLDKAGHGRLAVRPRHADHAQALRRMAEPVAAELRQRRARIAHAHPKAHFTIKIPVFINPRKNPKLHDAFGNARGVTCRRSFVERAWRAFCHFRFGRIYSLRRLIHGGAYRGEICRRFTRFVRRVLF